VRTMWDCQKIDALLSGYLDGELTQGDRQRVELHLENCAKCQTAYDDLAKLKTAVGKLSFDEMPEQDWRNVMNNVAVKASRGTGWVLYVVGLLVICGYAAFAFFSDDTVPALIKSGIAAAVVGLVLLFVSVLRERMVDRRTDKYEDVQI